MVAWLEDRAEAAAQGNEAGVFSEGEALWRETRAFTATRPGQSNPQHDLDLEVHHCLWKLHTRQAQTFSGTHSVYISIMLP